MLLIRTRSVAFGATVLATVALGAAGCSSSPAGEPSDEFLAPDTQAQVLQNVQALNYPFESDPSYSIRIANLQTRLINECVARSGVAPPHVQDLPLDVTAITPSQSRLWLLPGDDYGVGAALSDPAVVAQLGDDSVGVGGGEAPADPDAYDSAVYGAEDERIDFPIDGGGTASVPVGGCFGEATRTMYGVDDAADYERAYYEIPNIRDVMTTLLADGDVRDGVSAWSSCMKDDGRDYDSPDDLYNTMNSWVTGVMEGSVLVSTIEQDESDLAAADLACRTSSGLGSTLASVFLHLSASEISGNEGVVQEYRSMIEHAQALLVTS